jgi:hypothetical protein
MIAALYVDRAENLRPAWNRRVKDVDAGGICLILSENAGASPEYLAVKIAEAVETGRYY